MGLSLRLPGQIAPFETESVVSDGMVVVVGSANNKCALPGGASPTTSLLGVVMRPDGSSAAVGDTVDVVLTGIYPVIAAGSVSRKNLITSGGTDGTAMVEVDQDLQALRNDIMGLFALDIGNEAHAARIVLVAGIIKALLHRRGHRKRSS